MFYGWLSSWYLVWVETFCYRRDFCLLNTKYEKGSIDSKTGIAIKDINKDEEIFGNYGNSSQVKLL